MSAVYFIHAHLVGYDKMQCLLKVEHGFNLNFNIMLLLRMSIFFFRLKSKIPA